MWQLADSAFPAGGFAHSAGIEAAMQAGLIDNPEALHQALSTVLEQLGTGALPLVLAVVRDGTRFAEAELRADTCLASNHVAHRASRAQGLALLAAAPRVFGRIQAIRDWAQACREQQTAGHLAPVFGRLAHTLELDPQKAGELFVFMGLRSMLSAAVRLGILGPLQAQAMLHDTAAQSHAVLQSSLELTLDDIHQTAPLLDLLQASQDRLYSRLFQS